MSVTTRLPSPRLSTAKLCAREQYLKMSDETPREALERVAGLTPTTVETSKMEDPKKVEAGRRGAAARKAKQKKLPAVYEGPKPQCGNHRSRRNRWRTPRSSLTRQILLSPLDHPMQWTSYVLGGLGIAGILWLLCNRPHVASIAQTRRSNCPCECSCIYRVKLPILLVEKFGR